MKDRHLSESVKTAFNHAAPDVWEEILNKCEKRNAPSDVLPEMPPRKNRLPVKALGAAAAALVLVAGGILGAMAAANRVDSVITLDVNPSVQMDISRSEKVIQARALNEDGERLLGEMDLRGSNLDVAVNALIGSMMRQGYLDEYANSVLLSVQNSDQTRGASLERRLLVEIGSLLKAGRLEGAVLSQSIGDDRGTSEIAEAYGISKGKAALIQKIVNSNRLVAESDLAALSVNDLNLLLSSGKVEAPGVTSEGAASDKSYIGKEQAKAAALVCARVAEADVSRMEIEMDCDHGVMVYEVEFEAGGIEYELEVDAANGTILGGEPAECGAQSPAKVRISAAQARDIVFAHAGLSAQSGIVVEVELESNVYEISFELGGREYEYMVNAVTGEIVRWESERDDD